MLTDLLPAWPYITLARTASRRAGYLSLTSPLLWLSQPCHSPAVSASQQASSSRRTTSIHLHGVLRLQRSTRPDNRISLFPIRPSLDPLSLLPIPSCEVAVARDCDSTGQVPFPLPPPLPWSLSCTLFLHSWFCPRSTSPVSRVVPVDRGLSLALPLCPSTTSLSHPCEA